MSASEYGSQLVLCPVCSRVETPGSSPCSDCLAKIHEEGL